MTTCYSSGDHGGDPDASGQPRVQYPAVSPWVLACGGTRLVPAEDEVTWQEGSLASGGGFSTRLARPSWQQGLAQGSGRAIPDVAAKADVAGGYEMVVGATPVAMGGTSAASPLWAGLCARLAESLGTPLGLLGPLLYQAEGGAGLHDVTAGSNGTYDAGPGWDPCTGWGSPRGKALLANLARSS